MTEQEIRKLELEASVPTLEDQREQLEADIKEVKEILYKLELKLVKLR
jgi:chaperonin cofactor prefoldin